MLNTTHCLEKTVIFYIIISADNTIKNKEITTPTTKSKISEMHANQSDFSI